MAKDPADVTKAGRLFHKRGPAIALHQFLIEAQTGDQNWPTAVTDW